MKMKEIPLTQGKVALVDDDDYHNLVRHKWCAHKHGNTYYAERMTPKKPQHVIRMHRVVASIPENMVTDHINGNGLDNRKGNIRVATPRLNCQNKHIRKTSNYPGVCWHKRDKMWYARIWICGKSKGLGYFEREIDAALAYRSACIEVGQHVGF
jgi:hypothetical protein